MIDPTEQELLDEIKRNPRDEAARAVYADWLEKEGDLVRAEFVRLESQYHQIPKRLDELELKIVVEQGDLTGTQVTWILAIKAQRPQVADLQLTLEEVTGPHCSSCGNAIDPTVCWCGAPSTGHRGDEHSFVPSGCTCGYGPPTTQAEWMRVVNNLREQLHQARARQSLRGFTTSTVSGRASSGSSNITPTGSQFSGAYGLPDD